MPSVQYLREFINERLTAAAEEIFTEFEKTIVQYEEEIDRQRRLLDITWKPEIKLHRTELPQHYVCKEQQQLCNQERNSSLDQEEPEPRQMKAAEICSSQETEQLVTKEETVSVSCYMAAVIYEGDHGEPQPNRNQLHSLSSPETDRRGQGASECDGSDFQHQSCIKEEEVLTEQQLGNQERSSSPEQEEPEPPKIKEEQNELCSCQEGEQLALKEESDTFMVTAAEKRDHSEPESDRQQLLSHSSAETESKDKEGGECEQKNRLRKRPETVVSLLNSECHCDTDAGKKPVKCVVCGKFFKNMYYLKEHGRFHTGVKPFTCKTCERSSLRKRMRTHTGEKPYNCDTCGKKFTDLSSVKRHMSIHTGEKPYPCETCGKCFRNCSLLTVHKRIHTGEKPYHCKACEKRFSDSSTLRKHIRTHTGEKPYNCNTCGKKFTDMSSVKRHMSIHSGEKPYPCNICGKSFRRNSYLSLHIRTHTGQKPYLCKTCGKGFSRSSHLSAHMVTHTGEKPYACETCGRSFSYYSYLAVHRRLHTGEKPYPCKICGKRFQRSTHLSKHMITHTGQKP
ncbi:zinc finger protein 883-like [Archocentrus centrarchus]|uniref:zinc finger protein 883-like n=1 Tax=Archocentrus centrarchus TaxID=63155 RepID=UPI0011E9DADC|nr:zinc finger protein 883-like [Archocentrus centrarchus]